MDTGQIGPATQPNEAALWFYQEAMLQLRQGGEQADVNWLLDMAAKCALVSLAKSMA